MTDKNKLVYEDLSDLLEAVLSAMNSAVIDNDVAGWEIFTIRTRLEKVEKTIAEE